MQPISFFSFLTTKNIGKKCIVVILCERALKSTCYKIPIFVLVKGQNISENSDNFLLFTKKSIEKNVLFQ